MGPIEPVLDLRDVQVAMNELQAKIASVENIAYIVKNTPKVHRDCPQRRSIEDIEETLESLSARIEVTVFDNIKRNVVRYVKLSPDTHHQGNTGTVSSNLSSAYCNPSVRVGAIDANDGYLIQCRHDVLDLVFAMVRTRSADSWMCWPKGSNSFNVDVHVFDELDQYIRTCLKTKPTRANFEIPEFSY